MARLNHVAHARKERRCGKCGATIAVGDPYVSWGFRYAGARVRCAKPACRPAYWEYATNNAKRQALMRAADAIAAARDAALPDEAAAAIRDAIAEVEAARDEFRYAVDGWSGTGLEESQQYETFEQAVSDLEEWAEDAEDIAADLDAWTERRDEIQDVPDVDF